MKNYLLRRLREPSTMAGLASLAALLGMPAQYLDPLAQLVGALLAVAAVALPDPADLKHGPL